jgi:hypothetical protein
MNLRYKNRLEKAKDKYKIGTKITSLFGAYDTIADTKTYFGRKAEIFRIDKFGEIYANCMKQERLIYSEGTWAKIHL